MGILHFFCPILPVVWFGFSLSVRFFLILQVPFLGSVMKSHKPIILIAWKVLVAWWSDNYHEQVWGEKNSLKEAKTENTFAFVSKSGQHRLDHILLYTLAAQMSVLLKPHYGSNISRTLKQPPPNSRGLLLELCRSKSVSVSVCADR